MRVASASALPWTSCTCRSAVDWILAQVLIHLAEDLGAAPLSLGPEPWGDAFARGDHAIIDFLAGTLDGIEPVDAHIHQFGVVLRDGPARLGRKVRVISSRPRVIPLFISMPLLPRPVCSRDPVTARDQGSLGGTASLNWPPPSVERRQSRKADRLRPEKARLSIGLMGISTC
jgi:hypothetical protein